MALILAADPPPVVVELGFCVDDHEARQLGFPTAAAHRRMLDRVCAALQGKVAVKLVPRASTVATAAAAEQHDK